MPLFKEKFVCTDLYLRCTNEADLMSELKSFDSDRYIRQDEDGNDVLIMQGYNHALDIVGPEIDQEATYTTDEEGNTVVDQPATYTGNILVNLRFHRKEHETLANEFKDNTWIDVEIIDPEPVTPTRTFG